MRFLFLTFITPILLSGCAIQTDMIYKPSGARVERYCTGPYVEYRVNLVDDVAVTVNAGRPHGETETSIRLHVMLGHGKTFKLSSPLLEIEPLDKGLARTIRLDGFETVVFGREGKRGYTEQFPIDAILEGKGRNAEIDHFYSPSSAKGIILTNFTPAEFVLRFPKVIVNGRELSLEPVKFESELITYHRGICG